MGRISKRTVTNGSASCVSSYEYVPGGFSSSTVNSTSPLISKITQPGISFEYTYDECGNILSEKRGDLTTTYGYDSMGQLVSYKAMQMAIEKAKTTGVGIVSVRNSNHYGIAGYYAKMACDQGLMGFSCTNSEAIMVPTFGRKAMLGSNPIACAFPAEPYDFFFDASTTVVTRGKLEMYNKMEKPLPEGWALDKDGHPSSDAPDVLANIVAKNGGGIMPLGGSTEQLGSHKGYGYGMLCEIFSSILSMGATSNYCMTGGKGQICHSFMAINPAFFGNAEAIKAHFSTYLQELRERRRSSLQPSQRRSHGSFPRGHRYAQGR